MKYEDKWNFLVLINTYSNIIPRKTKKASGLEQGRVMVVIIDIIYGLSSKQQPLL
jgi:hypothetical protein